MPTDDEIMEYQDFQNAKFWVTRHCRAIKVVYAAVKEDAEIVCRDLTRVDELEARIQKSLSILHAPDVFQNRLSEPDAPYYDPDIIKAIWTRAFEQSIRHRLQRLAVALWLTFAPLWLFYYINSPLSDHFTSHRAYLLDALVLLGGHLMIFGLVSLYRAIRILYIRN